MCGSFELPCRSLSTSKSCHQTVCFGIYGVAGCHRIFKTTLVSNFNAILGICDNFCGKLDNTQVQYLFTLIIKSKRSRLNIDYLGV